MSEKKFSLEPIDETVAILISKLIKEIRNQNIAENEMEIVMAILNIMIQRHLSITRDDYETVGMISKLTLLVSKYNMLMRDDWIDQKH
tara:strand:- start:1536 stop:1799 length:264 start_codon:yes stop_codon:yes gene_type:complete